MKVKQLLSKMEVGQLVDFLSLLILITFKTHLKSDLTNEVCIQEVILEFAIKTLITKKLFMPIKIRVLSHLINDFSKEESSLIPDLQNSNREIFFNLQYTRLILMP